MAGIFDGIRVVEAATFVAGPAAGTIMSDFGAEVIHVEPPGIGDPHRLLYQLRPLPECEENYPWLLDSRNKKSVALNLKHADGRAAMYKLIATADVFITNYQPSVLADLGLRLVDLQPLNARLIYAHATGYGDVGEEIEKPGYDATAWWARSGMMDLIRPRGGEVALSAPAMGDHPTSVAMFSAIVLGLYRRERTGKGGRVTTSLMANGLWSNSIMAQASLCGGRQVPPWTHADSPNPLVATYQTKDERHFSLVMVKGAQEWELFCRAISREDLLADARFATPESRRMHARELVAILDALFAQKTLAEWTEVLNKHRVTFGIVQKSFDLPADPQMVANGCFRDFENLPGRKVVDSPIYVDGETKVTPRRPPELGEQTREVLLGAGYTDDAIEALVKAGAAA